jgi:hypothetical protein
MTHRNGGSQSRARFQEIAQVILGVAEQMERETQERGEAALSGGQALQVGSDLQRGQSGLVPSRPSPDGDPSAQQCTTDGVVADTHLNPDRGQ